MSGSWSCEVKRTWVVILVSTITLQYFACEKPVRTGHSYTASLGSLGMQTVFSGAVLVLHSIIVTLDGQLVLYGPDVTTKHAYTYTRTFPHLVNTRPLGG